jgi:hypothetical protein
MLSIRFGHGEVVDDIGQDQLLNRLSEKNGSFSVILVNSLGMKCVSYVDVDNGVVRKSYGSKSVLKACDFTEGGEAFR